MMNKYHRQNHKAAPPNDWAVCHQCSGYQLATEYCLRCTGTGLAPCPLMELR
jgi:uncharacterized paraquat-inducible protein A